jgi:dolichol-phosphate mannosyltransferase
MKMVPEYQINFTSEKKNNFCLIIPVVNEGERITRVLSKAYKNKIHEIADIIIIDGGSSDGSLEVNSLKSFGVSSLLTKIGQGKLSAQLLCAYDFCQKKQYSGIITIDGNDKDDPKDIIAFIKKLEEGYDFVQASRFIKGGYAKNTPIIRYIAIRLIHAPLLSIASGFYWTDTTQGFRAYSAKMLFSDKLQIFRDVFKNYELLAFLSYAAPHFGFKCIEIGTSRIYPKGKVPTKISTFSGNWELMKTLINVCLGRLNP